MKNEIIFRETLIFAVLIAMLALIVTVGCASGAAPEEEWKQTFGGTDSEIAYSVQQTTDGGYILAGSTKLYGAFYGDGWLVKTDSKGNKEWDNTFGGSHNEVARSVQQTTDGGYILAGSTASYGAGSDHPYDFWLVKTDSNGSKEWDNTFGGSHNEFARSVQQTTDGGYILAGPTLSYGAGSYDFWLVKTDSDGNKEWDNTFGGSYIEFARSVQQTADGGYILAGETMSYGAGASDFWLVKTDSSGNEQWNKTFGGSAGGETPYSVQQTADGGYILTGYTMSYGAGASDFWLVKTDSDGNREWDNTFGGTDREVAYSVQQTTDGGYILAGYTDSYAAGSNDFWLVKTYSNGNKEWDKTFGGCKEESANSVQQTTDGGYILAGFTNSYGAGSCDFWLVKVKGEEPTEVTELWSKSYDGGSDDCDTGVATDNSENVIVTGTSSGSYYTIKYDKDGNELWNKSYDGRDLNSANGVATDTSENVIVTGHEYGYGGCNQNHYHTIKYDKNGNELWHSRYGGPCGVATAYGVATDKSENIIVTGEFGESYTDPATNYYTIKYDKNGNELWNRSYDGGSNDDVAHGIATDKHDNVIVTGHSNDGSTLNYYTIKYGAPPPVAPELCPDEYRWGSYNWDPLPDMFVGRQEVLFKNIGTGDAYAVTATVSCTPVNVVASEPYVTLGDIPAGGSAWSSDTFELRTDMTNPQDPDKGICWRVEYDDVDGVHHVVEDVAQFCRKECSDICP